MNFSPFLTGSWENRFSVGTKLQIINPSQNQLEIIVAFIDHHGQYLQCFRSEEPIGPNQMWEIDTPKLESEFGVVKILAHVNGVVKPGLVGFQRRLISVNSSMDAPFSESQLSAIPMSLAQEEYDLVVAHFPDS
jgi:hypothetical protein